MTAPLSHLWINGPTRVARTLTARRIAESTGSIDGVGSIGGTGELLAVDCHRGHRGPYSGAAALLETVVPTAHEQAADLVRRHDIALLSAAPGLSDLLHPSRETLTSLAVPEERTRFYAPARTRRLAHSLTEFLIGWSKGPGGPLALWFDTADLADHTDREFLAILLRRADPALLRVLVGTNAAAEADLGSELLGALAAYAQSFPADAPAEKQPDLRGPDELATAYVLADGTSDVAAERAAYEQCDPERRAALHDQRADLLDTPGAGRPTAGALAYHRERGSDPGGAGVAVLRSATNYCVDMGFYHAALDLAERGRRLADPVAQTDDYCIFSTRMSNSLAVLGKPDEAEKIYFDLRSRYTQPMVHLFSNYAMGMLLTRHQRAERRDHELARIHLNTAIALASMMPSADQAFQSVFQQNGLALVEMHLGNIAQADRLVHEGLDRLNRELKPGEHLLHRSVLQHNRAQLRVAQGRLAEAVEDFDAVIEVDPNHPEYHFDRAAALRALGKPKLALADYEAAINAGLPFAEAYYNRADLRSAQGDAAGALDDFGYTLELEPDFVDARANRAALHFDLDQIAEAHQDVETGLAKFPEHPQLLCTAGLIAMQQGDAQTALDSFNRALASDPDLYEALVNRAVLAEQESRYTDALSDLEAASTLVGPIPEIVYNLGYVHEAAGHWAQAATCYTTVLESEQADADAGDLLLRRGRCRARLGDIVRARVDLEACLTLDDVNVDTVKAAEAQLAAL
jgi:tetratricopeptide (TPR) repeat protein